MPTTPMNRVIQHLLAACRRDGGGLTDGELLTRFLSSRDEAAFAPLVRRHGPMVWGVCCRLLRNHHDAEDAFQATFLVLVTKAASLPDKETVGNWLYGVAHQTAVRMRATAAKRGVRERQVTVMPEPATAEQYVWNDIQPVLDEELSRLPDKYRILILLCDLEGMTRREVAQHLGIPEGTAATRLATARAILAKRLTRRGIALSGVLLGAVLSQQSAWASVPVTVASSTIKAASVFAAGQTAGMISVEVAALTKGVLKTMFLTKLKATTAGLLLIALLCGTVGAIYQTQAAEQPKGEQKTGKNTGVSTSKGDPAPPKTSQPEYVITSRLLEAGADQPKVVLHLPKATVDAGQRLPIHINDGPQNLLAKVVDDEKMKIGTYLDVRVTHLLEGNKARLFCSFQKNEVETVSVSEIRVLGNSVQTIQDVELRKPVKVVFQKDAKGSAQRWVEITVDKISTDSVAPPKASKK